MQQLYSDRQTRECDGVALSDMVKGFWVCMFTVCFIICVRNMGARCGWKRLEGLCRLIKPEEDAVGSLGGCMFN